MPIAAGHARLLQGLAGARNLENMGAGAGGRETQAVAVFKRLEERLQASHVSTSPGGKYLRALQIRWSWQDYGGMSRPGSTAIP